MPGEVLIRLGDSVFPHSQTPPSLIEHRAQPKLTVHHVRQFSTLPEVVFVPAITASTTNGCELGVVLLKDPTRFQTPGSPSENCSGTEGGGGPVGVGVGVGVGVVGALVVVGVEGGLVAFKFVKSESLAEPPHISAVLFGQAKLQSVRLA